MAGFYDDSNYMDTHSIGDLLAGLTNDPRRQPGPPLAYSLPSVPLDIYPFTDNIQSDRADRDGDHNALGVYEYTPYGEYYSQTGIVGLFQFAGHLLDADDTNLYYAPYRWYDPAVARWTTRDPLGTADGLNVYAYVRENPTQLRDPLGRAEVVKHFETASVIN
jgi:RHS repeat-associated protein